VTPTRIIAARDPIGVTTLYQGWNSKKPGATYFSSELKAIADECDEIISFPPGHVYDSRDKSTTQYFQPSWWSGDQENGRIASSPVDFKLLRETLEASVRKRLMAEVPYGVLLSGGLDSSLIASIATREAKKLAEAQSVIRQNGANGPTENGANSDRGKSELSTSFVLLILTSSYLITIRASAAPFVLNWVGRLARPYCRKESCRVFRNYPSRVRLHCSRGHRCGSGSDIPPRDL